MYRKFWFENNLGAVYRLTEKTSAIFFDDPSGLGFSKELVTERIGNRETITEEIVSMQPISGELLFYKGTTQNKYQEYYNFIQFIKYKPIKFHYMPPNTTDSYFCDVVVTSLEKTQVDHEDLVMHCPIEIKPLSHWQTDQTRTIIAETGAYDDAKDYPLAYPYGYGAGGLNNIELRNDGTESVGMIIEIIGDCQNPQIALFDESNKQYGLLRLDGTFDYVRINTNDESEELYLELDGSPLSNPLSYQDFVYYATLNDDDIKTSFIQLGVGKSKMSCTFSNEFSGSVSINWRPTYATI